MDTIVSSVWFPLISGLASILGFLIALYPIQIHPLQPSEYRTLQWQKTLLIAAGFGIIISSCFQIYLKVSPKYEWINDSDNDYAVEYDNCSIRPLLSKTRCNFAVTFTPTTLVGERLATVNVKATQGRTANSLLRSLQTSVALKGKGTATKSHTAISIGQAVTSHDSSLFQAGDIKDLPSLITKLQRDSNQSTKQLSEFLWASVNLSAQQSLSDPNSTSQQRESALVQELNKIIQGKSIYEPSSFTGVALRPETQSLITQNPTGNRLIYLNRLLLEDAYPLEINRNQIIIKLSTATIDFGIRHMLTSSKPQQISLINLGEMPLEIDEISLTGERGLLLTTQFIFRNGEIWSAIFLLGIIITIRGVLMNPSRVILKRVLVEQEAIDERRTKHLKAIIGNEVYVYENLSTYQKNEYNLAMEYYANLQNIIIEMLTGRGRNYSRMSVMTAAQRPWEMNS